MKLEVDTKMFIDSLKQPKSKGLAASVNGKGKILDSGMSEVDGIPNMQLNPGSNSEVSSNNDMTSMTSMQPANTTQTTNDNDNVQTIVDKVVQITNPPTVVTATPSRSNKNATCTFKHEKPKLPLFAGDVWEYAIFRSGFKHAIEAQYSERDAITLLRTCLKDKPLELIKGIGSDYDAA